MSTQFGRWNFDCRSVDASYLGKIDSALRLYASDDYGMHSEAGTSVGYRGFHSLPKARYSQQPRITRTGAVITWDGRLDNWHELVSELGTRTHVDATDIEIVSAAYEAWGTRSFAEFIGDWAMVIWDPVSRTLVLSSDVVGARRIYYSVDNDSVTWCTLLDPLVHYSAKNLDICEDYLAGWLSDYPAPQLTPYKGVYAVPPASFVSVRDRQITVREYWHFDPAKSTKLSTDAEYEHRFLDLFAQSVQRRLNSEKPVVAELSGGMDSSSIVCMADLTMGRAKVAAPRLETVSYFNDTEPSWDERPYFTSVEKHRGRIGCHIKSSEPASIGSEPLMESCPVTPAVTTGCSDSKQQLANWIRGHEARVLLSGVGGDEVLGGVPTSTPELCDLVATGQFRKLFRQTLAWALAQRRPVAHVLCEAAQTFLPTTLRKGMCPVPWLTKTLRERVLTDARDLERRIRSIGGLPSFRENLCALDSLRRQLAARSASSLPVIERWYPYLDRDLLEFLYSVPREQLLRPGQRRSLMRRSLAGIVPDEILNRKRKAFAVRIPLETISAYWSHLTAGNGPLICESLGLIDRRQFSDSLRSLQQGRSAPVVQLSRTITLELWLRQTEKVGRLDHSQRLEYRRIEQGRNVKHLS